MSKQEVVRKAYGEYWDKMSDKLRKVSFENNGWIRLRDFIKELGRELSLSDEFEISDIYGPIIRSKSLQGIETNNSWTKIESESDLPKESGDYWTYEKNGSIGIRFFMSIPQTWGNHEMEVEEPNVTHYQPITKPLKPIY